MQLKILKRWEVRSKPPGAASGEWGVAGGGGGGLVTPDFMW